MDEDWRKIDELEIYDFAANVEKEFLDRRQVGIQKYGRTFVGDPLNHQREEILDALFYNWASCKERESLLKENKDMRNVLEDVQEFLYKLCNVDEVRKELLLEKIEYILEGENNDH